MNVIPEDISNKWWRGLRRNAKDMIKIEFLRRIGVESHKRKLINMDPDAWWNTLNWVQKSDILWRYKHKFPITEIKITKKDDKKKKSGRKRKK